MCFKAVRYEFGFHAISCRSDGHIMAGHHNIRNTLARVASKYGIDTEIEPERERTIHGAPNVTRPADFITNDGWPTTCAPSTQHAKTCAK
jgi:hypothetical protein